MCLLNSSGMYLNIIESSIWKRHRTSLTSPKMKQVVEDFSFSIYFYLLACFGYRILEEAHAVSFIVWSQAGKQWISFVIYDQTLSFFRRLILIVTGMRKISIGIGSSRQSGWRSWVGWTNAMQGLPTAKYLPWGSLNNEDGCCRS